MPAFEFSVLFFLCVSEIGCAVLFCFLFLFIVSFFTVYFFVFYARAGVDVRFGGSLMLYNHSRSGVRDDRSC